MRAVLLVLLAGCGRISFDPSSDANSDGALVAPAANAVVELSMGGFNSCVRLGAGDVWCWGRGTGGGLGDGTTANRGLPGKVPLVAPAIALSTNDGGTYALHADGTMSNWGMNDAGQLGLGDATLTSTARQVSNSNADLLGIGNRFGCIRRRTGQVACAGAGGHFAEGTDRLVFVDFAGVPGAIALSGGDDFECMLRADGAVLCWGFNFSGGFGNGVQSGTAASTPVMGPSGPYAAIAAGDQHVCSIRSSPLVGSVDCWGRGQFGELGDGTAPPFRAVPGPVPGLSDIVQLASASRSSCALHATGTVDCWGTASQLGDGSVADRTTPGPVPISDVVEISAHTGLHYCARKRDNTVWCWGSNVGGQIGRGDVGGNDALMPTPVVGLPGL